MSVGVDGRVFIYLFLFIYFLILKQSLRELYSSLVGGGNATFIGCQPPLNLIDKEEDLTKDSMTGFDRTKQPRKKKTVRVLRFAPS